MTTEITPLTHRSFYSKAAARIIAITPEVKVLGVDGKIDRIPGKLVEFMPIGDGYGRYITDDPEIIGKLENHPDVMSAEQYNNAITPDFVKLAGVKHENERLRRELMETNTLLAMLQAKGDLPGGPPKE